MDGVAFWTCKQLLRPMGVKAEAPGSISFCPVPGESAAFSSTATFKVSLILDQSPPLLEDLTAVEKGMIWGMQEVGPTSTPNKN